MDLRVCKGWHVVWAVVLVLAGGSYLQGAHGTSPPRPNIGINLPYVCSHDITLKKMQFKQGEFKGFSQYTRYDVDMPSLSSFTIHYWFNLATTANSSTFFSYGDDRRGRRNLLTVKLVSNSKGKDQFFSLDINGDSQSYIRINPPILAGEWNHALHSWNSETGHIGHYLNGEPLKIHQSYQEDTEIPGGSWSVSGQNIEVLYLNDGVDSGEGLNGWLTLFQMSDKPLSHEASDALAKAKLASQCSPAAEGTIISWATTPRKSYGGVLEAPSFSKACGRF